MKGAVHLFSYSNLFVLSSSFSSSSFFSSPSPSSSFSSPGLLFFFIFTANLTQQGKHAFSLLLLALYQFIAFSDEVLPHFSHKSHVSRFLSHLWSNGVFCLCTILYNPDHTFL